QRPERVRQSDEDRHLQGRSGNGDPFAEDYRMMPGVLDDALRHLPRKSNSFGQRQPRIEDCESRLLLLQEGDQSTGLIRLTSGKPNADQVGRSADAEPADPSTERLDDRP